MRSLIFYLILIVLMFALYSICKSPASTIPDKVSSQGTQSPSEYHYSNTLPFVHPYGGRIQLLYNQSSHNPSYDELLWFIHTDSTDSQQYIPKLVGCSEFAEKIQNNATKANITCGYVNVDFTDKGPGHACNIFDTTDEKLVFIDCTGATGYDLNKDNDKIVCNFGVNKLYDIESFDYTSLKEYQELNNTLATLSVRDQDQSRPMRLRGMSDATYKQTVEEYNNRRTQIADIEYKMDSIVKKWGSRYKPSWYPLGVVSNYEVYWPSQSN